MKIDKKSFELGLESMRKSTLLMIKQMKKNQKEFPNACSDKNIVKMIEVYLETFK